MSSPDNSPQTPDAEAPDAEAPEAPPIARLAPLIAQLVFAFRRNRGEIPEVLRPAGKGGERHVGTLIALAIQGPATVSELARRMYMTPAHASLVVGELARAGLVDRVPDERDRRQVIVSVSEAAWPGIIEMRERNAGRLLRFLETMDGPEADRFISQLERLVECMREGSPDAE
jgi:DNA-binding MarR family transcriptional regulator